MKKWLADDEDCLHDIDLWDSNLKTYHFPELILWLNQGGSLKKPKRGGAKEATTSGPSTSKSIPKVSTSKKLNHPAKKASKSKAGSSKCK